MILFSVAEAVADTRDASPVCRREAAGQNGRVVLVQTQAEGAGAQEISRILGRGLETRGYEVHHVFLYRKTAAFDDQANTFFCAPARPRGAIAIAKTFIRLVRHFSALQPSVVMCFQLYGCMIGALAARAAGVRAVIANRSTSMRSFYRPAAIRWLEFALGFTGLFSRVVVNSKLMEDEYQRLPDWSRTHISRIEHGFEPKTTTLDRDAARRALGLPGRVTLLGTAARLHPVKNLDAAIKLLPAEPSWHLALAGQGPDQSRLINVANALGVADRVHFVGELPPERLGTFLRTLDVFVFPSLVETFGLAAVEAAQAGVPVVANDFAVMREVLAADGEPSALFVNVNDAAAFAAAVHQTLADPGLRATLSARGAKLSRRFSLDAMTARYAALIEDVIHGSR